jgi:class 3 adenylate cyclase/tetratricopeptide (TPR) repeat protein
MKCPKCQSDNREGGAFCRACGQSLSMERVCPRCTHRNLPDSRFCDACGQELREPSVTPIDLSHPRTENPELAAESVISGSTTDGERKHVTVLFSDLSGYTGMAEKLDPEEVKEITAHIFEEVTKVAVRYDGFVEKYIGDAVVILFGVPKARENDHLRAIRAAKDIQQIVKTIGLRYQATIGVPLAMHTGIATGLVVTGEVNVEKGIHGVAGDTVNLASRLSSLAKPGEILVGENTHLRSKTTFSFEKLRPVSVKGKAEPVTPYRLLEKKVGPVGTLAGQWISSPLVGRTAEVAAIKGCINRLLDGRGGILTLTGDAGLGKSRLMAEMHRHFENEHFWWLEGRSFSYGQKVSYWPFREILWHWSGVTEDDSDTQAWNKFQTSIADLCPADSEEILPYLASLIGLEAKGELGKSLKGLDSDSMGKQIYLSSRRFFERVAQTCPLMLVFEDLHWADESSVLLIEHLFPLIDRVPLLICGVGRPEAASPVARLNENALKNHERHHTEIRLGALSPTECADLMNNLLAIENLPSRIRQLILQKVEGNPFFLEEIMRTLVDNGAVRIENGRWMAVSSIETITIPDTIQGVIIARIDRLDEEAKQVLKTASVIGRTFLYRLLKEVADALRQLDRHLDELVATELIRQKQKIPELEYIFKHALVQESAYESILLRKRHELHGKVASAIENLFSDRLDEFSSVLAYHYAKAELWEKAQEYLLKAGDQAGRIAADAEAVTHYQQALETYTRIFGNQWDPVQRGILERKMGEAFYRRGEYGKAVEYLERALQYFGESLPTTKWGVRAGILREIFIQLGHRLLPALFARPNAGQRSEVVEEVERVYETLSVMTYFGNPERLPLLFLKTVNFPEKAGYPWGAAKGYVGLALVTHLVRLPRLNGYYTRKAAESLGRMDHVQALAYKHFALAVREVYVVNRFSEGKTDGLLAAAEFRKAGYWNARLWVFATATAILSLCYRGDFGEAIVHAEDLVRFGEDSNDVQARCWGLALAGWAQTVLGRLEEATASLEKSVQLADLIPDYLCGMIAGGNLGRCYLAQHDLERALRVLQEGQRVRLVHRVPGAGDRLLGALTGAHLMSAELSGGARRSSLLRETKEALKKEISDGKAFGTGLPEALRHQGTYEWLKGRKTSARKWWLRGLAVAGAKDMQYQFGLTHFEIGTRLQDREYLEKAEIIFAGIGAEWDQTSTRRLLEELDARNHG